MADETSKYPECERLVALSDQYDTLHSFLDFLEGTEVELAEICDEYVGGSGNKLVPYNGQRDALLARHFDIDLRKVDRERRQMLADVRADMRSAS